MGLFLGEGDDGSGGNIVSIEGKSDRVVDGDDITLAKLAPVLNQRDIRGRFEHDRKITNIHCLFLNEPILYQQCYNWQGKIIYIAMK